MVLHVHAFESLGEKAGPVRLNLDLGGLQDGVDLLTGDGDIVVGEDEGGVDTGEFAVGHVEVVETGWSCKLPIFKNFGP